MLRGLLLLLLLAGTAVLGFLWALDRWYTTGAWPGTEPAQSSATTVPVPIERGMALPAIAARLATEGLLDHPLLWRYRVQLSGAAASIQAGEYELPANATPSELLNLLLEGQGVGHRLTIIEGTTINALLSQLKGAAALRRELPAGVTSDDLLAALGEPPGAAEGWFFPDTYQYQAGDSDRAVLLQAYRRMREVLDEAWRSRDDDLPYGSPYELLIMASIVEKESGRSDDRPLVAQVFVNRLNRGMRLQTDPTVIYGLGERFDGNLTRAHLRTDTPYNTYTRSGLPPTPIALPGEDALRAAAAPPAGDFLYFVARGDGTTEFSKTLDAHNAAVRRFQLRQGGGR